MITIACVEHGDYQGRGQEYVDKLAAMVARNLTVPHRFVCHRPTLPGWWGKVELFQAGRFEGRVLFLDLDTIVTGPLDELVQHRGILHLADWGWKKISYGSGVMCWDAGEHAEIWDLFSLDVPGKFKGDQDWLTHLGGWDALPKGLNVSYRYHAKAGPPPGAVTVSFHGRPKCHEFAPDHWVSKAWG